MRFARTDDDARAACAPTSWRVKATSMRFAREKNQELVAGGLLAEMLAAHGVPSPRFAIGPQGKPMLAEDCGLHFNLSHSGEVVMVVVADRAVGCDIEKIVVEDGRDVAFYERWTRREAGLKMLGCGFADGAAPGAPPHPSARNVPAPTGYVAAVCVAGISRSRESKSKSGNAEFCDAGRRR